MQAAYGVLPGRAGACGRGTLVTAREAAAAAREHREPRGVRIRCGAPWACAHCSALAWARHGADILEVLEAWHGMGGVIAHVALTVPHRLTDDLPDVLARLTATRQHSFGSRRPWLRIEREFGIAGFARVLEITDSPAGNGWHPHNHQLFLLPKGTTRADVDALVEAIRARWTAGLAKAGVSLAAADPAGHAVEGFVVDDPAAMAHYLSKGAATVVADLADRASAGDRAAACRWRELHERAKHATRVAVSRGAARILNRWRMRPVRRDSKRASPSHATAAIPAGGPRGGHPRQPRPLARSPPSRPAGTPGDARVQTALCLVWPVQVPHARLGEQRPPPPGEPGVPFGPVLGLVPSLPQRLAAGDRECALRRVVAPPGSWPTDSGMVASRAVAEGRVNAVPGTSKGTL